VSQNRAEKYLPPLPKLEGAEMNKDEFGKSDQKLARFPELKLSMADRVNVLLQSVTSEARKYAVLHGKTEGWDETVQTLRYYEEQTRLVDLNYGQEKLNWMQNGKGSRFEAAADGQVVPTSGLVDIRTKFGKKICTIQRCIVADLSFNVLSPYALGEWGWKVVLGSPKRPKDSFVQKGNVKLLLEVLVWNEILKFGLIKEPKFGF
ncbi:unnamed protein product, partial [Effrenium voratum]